MIWKKIDGFDGYEVSSCGQVKSVGRFVRSKGHGVRWVRDRILRPETDKDGYLKVVLSVDGKPHKRFVHRLVAKAFIENPSSLPQVNHLDGQKKHNRFENLEWATNSTNVKHAFDVLNKPRMSGDLHGLSKLTADQVLSIRLDRRLQRDIAADHGIQQSTVSKIKRRERWVHL